MDARGGGMTLVKLDTRRITDWDTFHDVFAEVFGFPNYYGRNLSAWVDCMISLDVPSAKMTAIHTPPGGLLVLQLEDVDDFAQRCPEQYAAIVESSAFVNWRRLDIGHPAVLALSFYKHSC